MLDEIRRVEAEQGRIVEEIEDLKSSITQTIEEEVRKQKNSLELGWKHSMAFWKIKKPRMSELSLLVLSIFFLVFSCRLYQSTGS